MRDKKGHRLLGATVLLVVSLSACMGKRERDLSETLAWMDQTYNPHEGGSNLGQGYGREVHYVYGKDEVTEEWKETFTNNGCKMTVRREQEPIGVFRDVHSTYSDAFNLYDIDPQSIKVSIFDSHDRVGDCADPEQVDTFHLDCDQATVSFTTRNSAPVIDEDYIGTFEQLQGADHESRNKGKESSDIFMVENVDYAQHFIKAFKHAIELCGGKASKF